MLLDHLVPPTLANGRKKKTCELLRCMFTLSPWDPVGLLLVNHGWRQHLTSTKWPVQEHEVPNLIREIFRLRQVANGE